MKIVEKKCPNCGASLDFKVGERDIVCSHCRRKFAVKYDGVDFAKLSADEVNSLKDVNIDLKPLRNIFITAAIIFVIASALSITLFVGIFVFIASKVKSAADEQFQQTVQDNQEWIDQQSKYRTLNNF